MKDGSILKHTFNRVARLYNEIRPRYPDSLFSTLAKVTGLLPGARLLEIGAGTGQATMPLAKQGYNITAIELGDALAGIARHELRSYPNVRVVTGAFENIELPANTFDLVFAATAFHWIKEEFKYAKTHEILKSKGHLAIFRANDISDEKGNLFFEASQPVYDRYFADEKNEKFTLPEIDSIRPYELDEKLFHLTHFQNFPLVITYSAEDYAKLLNTYSPNLALPAKTRTGFLKEIKTLINEKFNGSVNKHYAISLTVAGKL